MTEADTYWYQPLFIASYFVEEAGFCNFSLPEDLNHGGDTVLNPGETPCRTP